ncbi:hypothetical protein BpHYR1_027434, partial [Brachionus plicatilis]
NFYIRKNIISCYQKIYSFKYCLLRKTTQKIYEIYQLTIRDNNTVQIFDPNINCLENQTSELGNKPVSSFQFESGNSNLKHELETGLLSSVANGNSNLKMDFFPFLFNFDNLKT